ncbi:MAG: glycoside hydrolase family 1 protein [Acidimicrobiia bacterium]
MTRALPDGFLWGTATAAHQVEGGNWNNDWWAWEHDPASPCAEPSGDACDHFWRYPADIAMLAELGFNAYRFSLEWSRIEPEEGELSRNALDHYRRMLACCHEHGIVPVLTYHHFTTPRWAAAGGGWSERRTAERFARFCERAAAHLGDLVGISCTINEPNVVSLMGYFLGEFPPGLTDGDAYLRANDVMVHAHQLAYDAIKGGPGDSPVGLTLAMSDFQAVPGGEEMMQMARTSMEDVFLEAARGNDYVGAQMYTRIRFGPEGLMGPEDGVRTTLMGYEFWPQSLEATVRRAVEVAQVPVIVTENGISVTDDAERVEYVTEALRGLGRCLDDGLDVRGYFYWSLLDNFEWAQGYAPTFGLVAVDRETQERSVKPSARWLGAIARANTLTV